MSGYNEITLFIFLKVKLYISWCRSYLWFDLLRKDCLEKKRMSKIHSLSSFWVFSRNLFTFRKLVSVFPIPQNLLPYEHHFQNVFLQIMSSLAQKVCTIFLLIKFIHLFYFPVAVYPHFSLPIPSLSPIPDSSVSVPYF